MRLARVFPRRTNATPKDPLSFIGEPGLYPPKVDAVHISVAFSWDMPEAEWLAKKWSRVAPTSIGGPATGMRGEEFIVGEYLSPGHTITSRGCSNRCWFCEVWKRDGKVRELPIQDGWIVTDDNILGTSDQHFSAVCEMLHRQPKKPEFRGGLEANLLTELHATRLRALRPSRMYFAYDTPEDLAPLRLAGEILMSSGFTVASHVLCAYVLCGYKGDTKTDADRRMWETIDAGFMPYAMLWRGKDGKFDLSWKQFQRSWVRPEIVATKMRSRYREVPYAVRRPAEEL